MAGLSAVALSLLIPTDLASNFDAEVVEAHCYFFDIGRTDREQKRSRIDNNDCRAFRPSRPLSLRTKLFCAQLTKAVIVIDSATYLLTISSPDKTLMLSASICVKCPFWHQTIIMYIPTQYKLQHVWTIIGVPVLAEAE